MQPQVHKKVWGEELWIANNELYCGKILRINKGYRCSYHSHPIKDETFYVLKGEVLMRFEGNEFTMKSGDSLRVFPGQYHSFAGLTDSEILEISTSHSDNDVVRMDESRAV